MTLLAFFFAIGLLVTVHEWGHYRVAVACGVKVYTFSVGFGPTLLKWRAKHPHPHQDTEFQIGLLPLGGYVRMADEREGEVAESDLPMAFNRQPLWARAVIVVAGPLANLLLAVVLFAAMNMVGRYETAPILSAPTVDSVAYRAGLHSGDMVLRAGLTEDGMVAMDSLEALRAWMVLHDDDRVVLEVKDKESRAVRWLKLDSPTPVSKELDGWQSRRLTSAWSKPVLGDVLPSEPAGKAGLQRGDQVIKVDGRWINDAAQLRALIRSSGTSYEPQEQTWEISRVGHLLTLSVQPARVPDGTAWMGRVGAQIGEPPEKYWIERSPLNALWRAWVQTQENIASTAQTLIRLLLGVAAWDRIGGPLMIADYAGRTAEMGLGVYLGYLAMLSVSLGVFNLLPLPVLDGGHLLYYLYEFVTGKSPSDRWLGAMQRLGLALLLTLMIFSFLNDARRLGWLG